MQVVCHMNLYRRTDSNAALLREWWHGACLCALVLLLAFWSTAGHALSPLADDAQVAAERAASQLYQDTRDQLARLTGADPAAIDITPLDSRVMVPACAKGWHATLPFNTSTTVKVRCPTLPASPQYFLRAKVILPQSEVVLARSMKLGDVLQADDLKLAAAAPGREPAFTDVAPLIGRSVRVSINAGTPLVEHHLQSTVTVFRLKASYRSGAPLQSQDIETESIPISQAPQNFWSAEWPAKAALKQDFSAGHILRHDDWVVWRDVVVANTHIPKGAALTPDMVTTQSWPEHKIPQLALTDVALAAGKQAIQEIPKGTPLSELGLRAAVLVKRGNMVMISAGDQGFAISTRVEALQDGRLGQQIRFKNPLSGRIISGIVTAQNEAKAL